MFLSLRDHRHMVPLTDDLVGHHLHLVADFVETTAHEPLDRINCVFRISNGLAFGDLANQSLTRFGERDHRRCSPAAFFICYDLGFPAFHNGYNRVGRTQVNTDNLCHIGVS